VAALGPNYRKGKELKLKAREKFKKPTKKGEGKKQRRISKMVRQERRRWSKKKSNRQGIQKADLKGEQRFQPKSELDRKKKKSLIKERSDTKNITLGENDVPGTTHKISFIKKKNRELRKKNGQKGKGQCPG